MWRWITVALRALYMIGCYRNIHYYYYISFCSEITSHLDHCECSLMITVQSKEYMKHIHFISLLQVTDKQSIVVVYKFICLLHARDNNLLCNMQSYVHIAILLFAIRQCMRAAHNLLGSLIFIVFSLFKYDLDRSIKHPKFTLLAFNPRFLGFL